MGKERLPFQSQHPASSLDQWKGDMQGLPPPPEKGQVQLWEQDTPKQYGDTSSDHMKWEAFGNVINMYKGTWVAV